MGAMHSFAVVAQSLLREAFGVANRPGGFSPGVAVAVERDTFDVELAASLVKFPVRSPAGNNARY